MSHIETPQTKYTPYDQIDKEQLKIDIEEAKAIIGNPSVEDFQHLLKMERWGRMATFSGFFLILAIAIAELSLGGLSGFIFWPLAILSAIFISTGNVGRWANVTHPILHGAYDKVPNIPEKYKKKNLHKGVDDYGIGLTGLNQKHGCMNIILCITTTLGKLMTQIMLREICSGLFSQKHLCG